MALKITDNFNYTGRKPNFQRDQFATTSEMNAYTVCDEGHISYNLQDNKHYSFKNGAWSVLQTGGGGSSYTHPSSHPASIITYDSSEAYESGNVGYEIKQLVTSLAAKYVKPGTGIPKADLANDVQTSLGYADDYNTNKSSFVTSTALETALTGLSPYSAGTGISITTVSNGKQIAVDTAVYKVKDVQNASGTSLVTSGIATIPITSIKDSGGNDLTVTNGAVTLPAIPAVPITQINKSDNTQLSPVSGVVTLPEIPNDAADISFDDSVTHLSTQLNPVTSVQDAIEMIVSNVTGTTGRLTVNLQYTNTIGISNKKCKIVVYYQGVAYKPNTFPANDEFTTDSNGDIILNLPLGSTYTITPIDIEDYITPEEIYGIVDDSFITKTLIYNAVSNNERILFVVNIKNVSPQITVNNKKLYIDIYNPENLVQVLTEKAYTCTLGTDGTPKLIEDHLGNTIATGKTLYFEIPKGTKIKAYLQTWDGTDSLVQEYVKSSDVIITANKNKDTITFYYSNVNYGLYLLLKDNTKEKGYSKNKILEVDSDNNRFTCNIGGYNYIIYKENSKVYRILEGTSDPEEWLSNTTEAEIMLGVGISSSQTNAIEAKDDSTTEQGFLTLDFFVPRVVQYERGTLVNGSTMPVFDNYDGMYITRRMSEYNETVKSVIAQNAINNYNITLNQGNDEFVIPGFIPSTLQFNQFRANYTAILIVTNIFSGTPITKPVSISTNTYIATCTSSRNSTTMEHVDTYGSNLDVMNSWTQMDLGHQFYVFYPFA